jgi:multiple coagulation factor deficiency protein 2
MIYTHFGCLSILWCLSSLTLIYASEQGSKEQDASGQQRIDEKVFSDDELVSLIDPILQMDDISRDGFIDYPEFIKAQQKAAANQQQQQQQHEEHQED